MTSEQQSHPAGVPTGLAISPDSGVHWAEPGAWKAAEGVYRIPLPLPMDGLKAVNVYVLEHADGLTLVDGGWAIEVARDLLDSGLASIGCSVRDIKRFLVTHVHRDHYTQAVTIRKEVGSHVSLGIGDKPTLDLMHDDTLQANPQVEMLFRAGATEVAKIWGQFSEGMEPDLGMWEYPDTWLEGDHRIDVGSRVLDAVHTPGHTHWHYVFADMAAGLLFAGDHVLPTITPSIGFEPVLAEQPLGDFMGSLRKVRQLPDLRLFPAHGPVWMSSHTRADELLAFHDLRLQLCLDAIKPGGVTAHDVAAALPWTRHNRDLKELEFFDEAMATMETRAHLELLVAEGKLTKTETEDLVVYGR